jgi:hypothetical protein
MRWKELSSLADNLANVEEDLTALSSQFPPKLATNEPLSFQPKSSEPYLAVIRSRIQRKSRSHEAMVKSVAEFLQKSGHGVSNPHPRAAVPRITPAFVAAMLIIVGEFAADTSGCSRS